MKGWDLEIWEVVEEIFLGERERGGGGEGCNVEIVVSKIVCLFFGRIDFN